MGSPEQRRVLQHALKFTPLGQTSGEGIHLISQGVSELTEEFNPETEETHYIGDQNGTTTLKRYAMTVPLTMEYINDDEVCKFIRSMAMQMPTGDKANVEYIRFCVLDKESNPEGQTGESYTAYQYNASISISNIGGAGEDYLGIEAQINLRGDPITGIMTIGKGTNNTTTYTFTEKKSTSSTTGT